MIRIGAGTAGRGREEGEPPVDALLACHERIRSFTALALRLASTPGLDDATIRDAAAGVHRYFDLALPLHARDEEESLLPRLRGLDPDLDRELAAMHAEHAEHLVAVGRVLEACEVLRERPRELPRVAAALASAASQLQLDFDVHLGREERVIFPAVRGRLDPDARRAIEVEMRARREE